MIITNVNSGQKAGYSLSGTNLTIGGEVKVDLQERQQTVERVIDVCLDNQLETIREGLGAWYVAIIIIPPKKYRLQPSGEQDENGDDIMEEVELPVDTSQVELRLWGLPPQYFDNKESEIDGEDEETEQGDEE